MIVQPTPPSPSAAESGLVELARQAHAAGLAVWIDTSPHAGHVLISLVEPKTGAIVREVFADLSGAAPSVGAMIEELQARMAVHKEEH
jgi:hypothetical protein